MRSLALSSAILLTLASSVPGCGAGRGADLPPATAAENQPPATFDPGGIGALETRTERGDTGYLALTRVTVAARQRGDMAEVAVEHVFQNDSDFQLEGTFRFPMPDGAILTGLAMMIDGKLMEGELVERDKARKVYEAIVDGMQDPALLEWEHGSTFKMRVFPIEAHREKVVTLRYLAPLRRAGNKLDFVQGARARAGSEKLAELRVDWEGARVFAAQNVPPDHVVEVPAQMPSDVLREKRSDGVYTAVRLAPDWSKIPAKSVRPAKNWFVVVDTSRSSLEERALEIETLRAVIAALPAGARFQTITSDLDARAAEDGLLVPSPLTVARAVEFVERTSADGASDLGQALRTVSSLAKGVPDSAAIYIGDCEPTWGITQTKDLRDLATHELEHTPLYPIVLGSSVDEDLADELAQVTGGRRARAKRREDLDAFLKTLALGVPTLTGVEVSTPPGTQVFPAGPFSLEAGRPQMLFLKSLEGEDPLASLHVRAKVDGRVIDLVPHSTAPAETGGVARRFGSALVRELEKTSAPSADVVQASVNYGVMSKLTSFLVLENEEAYARYAIERRRSADASDAPRITGANLESADGADISANRIQPGDPEITIDAERDARWVRIELPSGEIKEASYDREAQNGRGAWMVRFLVDRETPEGQYRATATIAHRDGHLEKREVGYTVDRTPPEIDVRVRPAPHRPGMTEIVVTQRAAPTEPDLRRVELRTPHGEIHQLTAIRWGTFRTFVPRSELVGPNKLRVVGVDQALNHTVAEVPLP